jgi:hypothetical protein
MENINPNTAILAVPIHDNVAPGPSDIIPEAQPVNVVLDNNDTATLQRRYEKLQRDHNEALQAIVEMRELIVEIRGFATDIASTATTDLSAKIQELKRAIAEDGGVGKKRARRDSEVYIA